MNNGDFVNIYIIKKNITKEVSYNDQNRMKMNLNDILLQIVHRTRYFAPNLFL